MRKHILALAISLFLTVSGYAGSEKPQHCDCDISESKERAYNELLKLDPDEKNEAIATHLPWGVPKGPEHATHEELLCQGDYILDYDDDLRLPIWAAYRLTKHDLETHRERTECFRRDIRVSDEAAAACEDYDEPVFDRGHLVPNADMERSEAAMINTYIFSNMTPQHAKFNQGIWGRLESYTRSWAKLKDEVYIISGSIFDQDGDRKRDADSDAKHVKDGRVAVPTHFFKIIVHKLPDGHLEVLAFVLPHDNKSHKGKAADGYLKASLVTVHDIESVTGMEFFPKLEKSERDAVEGAHADRLWSLK